MKQNEKFLVYAVTGFLVVILAVAILFGDDVPRRLPGGLPDTTEIAKAPPSLEEVLNQRANPDGAVVNADAPAAGSASGTDGGKAGDAPLDSSDPNANPAESAAVGNQPLVANVQLLPPTPAALVTEKLGLSRRENDFRLVRARQGDSLGSLVQTWCGSTSEYLEQAKGLNETLTTLKVGQEIVLPWVEDEVLLQALESRKQPAIDGTAALPASLQRPAGSSPSPAIDAAASSPNAGPAGATATPGPAPAATLRKYKVKAGDSLWKIAEREVGKKQAPRFLDQVKELNPGLDADRIREGQELLLPPKG